MSESINQSELFVTLGRVEAKVDALSSIDGRLRKVEQAVHVLESGQNKKVAWPTLVLLGFGAITAIGGLITLFVMLSKISDALAVAPL